MTSRWTLAVLAILVPTVAGCADTYTRKYRAAVSANRQRVETIEPGMTRQDVESLMGRGPVVVYKKIELRNPWRTDAYRKDGHSYDVLYYVTSGQTWTKTHSDEQIMTPVVLRDGKVLGLGWELVDRTPRYVSGPFGTR
jgi:hypothetical protein